MKGLISNTINLESIINTVYSHRFKVYIVGGAVRDHLSGLNPKDIDLATDATPKELLNIFGNRNIKLVGESFGVIIVDGFEIATFRNDKYFGNSDKNCEITFSNSIEEDLKRRDFTINAIAYCPNTGNIIDLHNGQNDIKNKIIRFVNDPNDRIKEDPNRIIRAARFASKIDGEIEFSSFNAMKNNNHLVNNYVSPERIRLEIIKAMSSKHASTFFNILLLIDSLKYIFPSLCLCYESSDHGVFHQEDIYTHNMLVGDSISYKNPLLKLSGYLHDIGKPYVYEDGHFYDHEKYGMDLCQAELKYLKFSNDEIEYISNLVRCHMYSLKDISNKAVRKLAKKLKERNVSFHDFLRLKIADRTGNIIKEKHSIEELKEYHKKLFNVEIKDSPFCVKDLDINGVDIMREFNLSPGREVGNLLTYLLEYVIENGNEFNTFENLLNEANEYAKQNFKTN